MNLMMFSNQKGVTLIEVLIATAIIAAIISVAYPSYTSSVLSAHRSTAMTDLTKIQIALEQEYDASGTYSAKHITNDGECDFCESDPKRYSFSINIDLLSAGSKTYVIAAKPQKNSGQKQDECGTLFLDAAGIGTSSNSGTCW